MEVKKRYISICNMKSMTVCMGRTTNQEKYQNGCHLETTSLHRLMCIYGGHRCICVPNMKFLCLTLWQGEVCTDDDDANDDANANNDGKSMIVLGSLVDKPNKPKIHTLYTKEVVVLDPLHGQKNFSCLPWLFGILMGMSKLQVLSVPHMKYVNSQSQA